MAKKKQTKEPDSVYFLKILLYFLLGSMWLRIESEAIVGDFAFSLPIGLLLGLYFAHHEHFQIDRKIEYAVLLAAAVLSFVAPIGFLLII